jgi:hypothetical protein
MSRPANSWTWALVTGASSGIGECIARRLAEKGVHLVLVARRGARLEDLAAELRGGRNVEVETITADLTDESDCTRVEARLAAPDRPIDLLVNNAGGGRLEMFPEGAASDPERMIRLNVSAVARLTAAVLPGMRRRRCGTILNVSSGAAFQPSPFAAVYGASKAFVTSFSEAIREENRPYGIRVTVVCPGFTRTELPHRTGFDVDRVPRALWMTADEVARQAVAAAARGRGVHVPGILNKLGAFMGRYAPRPMVIRSVASSTRRLAARELVPPGRDQPSLGGVR